MAVRRRFYGRFASYLAECGLRVLTFDYRGIGDSAPARLSRFEARLLDWARKDAAAALGWAGVAWNLVPSVVGHSVGGQILGLLPQPIGAQRALLVAAQSGYWKHWNGLRRAGMWLLWHGAIPATTRLWGYFPAAAFALGENTPAGVAREWASWGRAPGYVLDAEGGRFRSNYTSLSLPLRSYSFSDDTFAPPAAVTALLDGFTKAPLERRALRPSDLGRTGIGHWGFFREDLRDSLWVEAAEWLGGRRPSGVEAS